MLAKADYSTSTGPVLALIGGLLAAALVLTFLAWMVGAFDRTKKGRHAADRLPMSPWIANLHKDATTWLVRNQQVQRDLVNAYQGGEER